MLAQLPLGRIVLRILIGALCVAAVVASYSLLGAMGIAPIAGLIAEDGDATLYFEILGIVLVGQLLFTALAPLVRRLSAGAERPVVAVPTERERLVIELTAVADRLERLDAGPQVHAECERLRRLARSAAR